MPNDVWEKVVLIAPDLGITREALRKARERHRIPYRWRLPLLQQAAKRGMNLTADDLEKAS